MKTISTKTDMPLTIGVDLGGTNVRAGLVKNGKVTALASSKIPQTETNTNKVIGCITETIEKVFEPEVAGIGIGVPGLIDRENGFIHSVVNIPSFMHVPLEEILNNRFGVQVKINNDVNCFALGEKNYGAGKNIRNMVGLSLGTGMGVGIISGGKLLEDANGGSGEFGEIPYKDANFEAYCSGQFFQRTLNKSGEEVFALAQNGDVEAKNAYVEFGTNLGKAIHTILLTLDPQAIIIGGSVAQSKELFHDAMMSEVQKFIFPKSLEKLQILYASQKNSPVLGAAKLVENILVKTLSA